LHPILKVRHEFRNIFLELGFEEMPTNNFVESSFWNFDALFQPQSHPARDAHDTFFIAEPSTTRDIPADYMKVVKQMHEVGGHGSIGYRYDWQESEARKNILRTHTTAVSTRMLYLLGQNKPFVPKKYFSIDRVFRNEATDATHLAEFHQVEGLIADYNLTLPDLIGSIAQFFGSFCVPTQVHLCPNLHHTAKQKSGESPTSVSSPHTTLTPSQVWRFLLTTLASASG
jgi:phenylalanyl-tRNA synthetase alpha chain